MKKKISMASLLVALGIVYGDIGTSPLYVVKSLIGVNDGLITKDIVYGGMITPPITVTTAIKWFALYLIGHTNWNLKIIFSF